MAESKRGLRWWLALALFALVLVGCYWPVVTSNYGFYDDYRVVADHLSGNGAWGWDERLAGGRPTHAVLTAMLFEPVRGVGGFRFVRLLSIGFIAGCATLVYTALMEQGWSGWWALATTLLIVSLPAFQVYAAWALTASYVLAALAAAGAFFAVRRGFAATARWEKGASLGLAALLMVLSATDFQPGAMFFWLFVAITLFVPRQPLRATFAGAVRYGLVALAGLLPAFGLYKLGVAYYGGRYLDAPRAHLSHAPLQKLEWFFNFPLRDSLQLSSIAPPARLAWVMAGLIVTGLWLYFEGRARERLAKLALALILLPLAYAPNLLVQEDWSSFRTQVGVAALVALYFALALIGWMRSLPGPGTRAVGPLLMACACVGLVVARHNVNRYIVSPQVREYRLARAEVLGAYRSGQPLYLVNCSWKDSLTPPVRYDEFGFPSCTAPWIPVPMAYLILRSREPQLRYSELVPVDRDHPIPMPPGAAEVDLHAVMVAAAKPAARPQGQAQPRGGLAASHAAQ